MLVKAEPIPKGVQTEQAAQDLTHFFQPDRIRSDNGMDAMIGGLQRQAVPPGKIEHRDGLRHLRIDAGDMESALACVAALPQGIVRAFGRRAIAQVCHVMHRYDVLLRRDPSQDPAQHALSDIKTVGVPENQYALRRIENRLEVKLNDVSLERP